LKCAGAIDRPSFDGAALEAIFNASGGIPRRINLICDRLLLLGFLGEKDAFGLEDVNEVVSEIHDESAPASATAPIERSDWDNSEIQALSQADSLDIDLAKLQISPSVTGALLSQIDALGGEQFDGRLRRVERSVLRLERINLEILVMLQKLVSAVAKPNQENNQ
jgi:general secretion pathway protein A